MSVPRRIAAFFTLAEQDIDAAEMLATRENHYGAYHCQQAAEKILKAILIHRGIEAGIEHQLYVLIEKFPDGDTWRAAFAPLLKYSSFATTYRYPTPGGRIPPAPDKAEVIADVTLLRRLLTEARKALA